MINRRRIALAAVSISCLFPIAVHAGAGGTPTAPAAGKSTEYCCQVLERGTTTQRHGADEKQSTPGNEKNTATFVNGTGCQAIDEDVLSRNACPGTTVKCRGEFFTPSKSEVLRCLTP
jgi:hypothetical protein